MIIHQKQIERVTVRAISDDDRTVLVFLPPVFEHTVQTIFAHAIERAKEITQENDVVAEAKRELDEVKRAPWNAEERAAEITPYL